jgi:hypothetical protein
MAHNKKPYNDNFADLVARLNAMSNITPDKERKSLLEAATDQPRLLDEKDVSLADIAKLAGIKEYVEPIKVSKKAKILVEEITKTEPTSSIAKAIKESDADDSISTGIKKAVTEESNRLDKIANLETQLAELKAEQKEEQTYDSKAFREVISTDIAEYIKNAEEAQLVELYNTFSDNEAIYNEEQKNILVKTPETTEVIADAEAKEAEDNAEVVQEKEPEDNAEVVQEKEPEERLIDLDKEVLPDPGTPSPETPAIEDGGEEVEIDAIQPAVDTDKFTNDLDPAPKEPKIDSTKK